MQLTETEARRKESAMEKNKKDEMAGALLRSLN